MKKIIIEYQTISASGNPTAIIYGSYSGGLKTIINKKIFAMDKNVEQIGYINTKTKQIKFDMMGNEFSANGCRAATYSLLKGDPGLIKFRSSGINKIIQAQIEKNGYSIIKIPIKYNDIKINICKYGWCLYIFGSNIYVIFSKSSLKMVKKIIEYAKEEKAIGVMFIENNKKNEIIINPFFYVKETNTLFNETACGSGSIATAMVLAINNQQRTFRFIQLSKQPIIVKLNDNKIIVSGPTKFIDNKRFQLKY